MGVSQMGVMHGVCFCAGLCHSYIYVWGKGRWARRLIELFNKPVSLGNESYKSALGDVHINPVLGFGHQTCKSTSIPYASWAS